MNDLLELSGEGDLGYGYLGGMLDAATGLIYLGDGQYYDPSSGRFLTRDLQSDRANPYAPWNGDPLNQLSGGGLRRWAPLPLHL